MNWQNCKRINIALNDQEALQLAQAKAKGFGPKKLFKAILDSLVPISTVEIVNKPMEVTEEE